MKKKQGYLAHFERSLLLDESLISFQPPLPISLRQAINVFCEHYPNWDKYRLIKAALVGFLVQNVINSRPINRIYIENMFKLKSINRK